MNRRHLRVISPLSLFAVLAIVGTSVPQAGIAGISPDQRIAAQRAIEEVYWQHRIWPAQNPQPKPPLAAVLSDDAIRAKVDDYLRKSAALETYWGNPITGAQLEAETRRVAAETRDPALLRELFAALGNDPRLIAETLVRDALADRLVRARFAGDGTLHADVRQRAEGALARGPSIAELKRLGGEYAELTVSREEADPAAGPIGGGDRVTLGLAGNDWNRLLSDLSARFSGDGAMQPDPASLPVRIVSPLREEEDCFSIVAILERSPSSFTMATVRWAKRPFDEWWAEVRHTFDPATVRSPGDASADSALPPITAASCTTDTWTDVRNHRQPTARYDHSAVWTGTEMLVWGGYNTIGAVTVADGARYNPTTDTWTRIATSASSPTQRRVHTAVWTGMEMVVWGGLNEGSRLNTGGRYSPQTDAWTATSTGANVPTGRIYHTAVWTGAEMIVWGGDAGAGAYLNTGGRYSPSSDTWTATSTGTGVPSGRREHTAVWTGTEMVVWGGSSGPLTLNTGGRYTPSSNSWTATSTGTNVPAARDAHTAVWTGTEMIIWGGMNNAGSKLNTGGRYKPSSNSWTATSTGANVPEARGNHTAVWTGTEMIVWGGLGSTYLNTGGRYTPSSNSWTATSTGSNVPLARWFHTAVWSGTEMIVWGGFGSGGPGLETGGRYSLASDSWTATFADTNLPAPRYLHSAIWTGTEMIVWGGYGNDEETSTGARYNPALDSWTATPAGPSARSGQTAVWTGMEMIIWGGSDGTNALGTGSRFNPLTDLWAPTTGAGAPAPRTNHSAIWTGTEMIVWGGNGSTYFNDGARYDPASDSWTATSTVDAPSVRGGHSAVWTGVEMIVWGGFFYDTAYHDLGTGGRYSAASDTWAPVSTGSGCPSARRLHTAIWGGSEMIVWGGWDETSEHNDGARYRPSSDTWTPTSAESGVPTARDSHTAVWTGLEMIVWGGRDTAAAHNDGARYDPQLDAWTPTTTSGAPEARGRHTAALSGSEMIVWGGTDYWYLETGARYCAPALSSDTQSCEIRRHLTLRGAPRYSHA